LQRTRINGSKKSKSGKFSRDFRFGGELNLTVFGFGRAKKHNKNILSAVSFFIKLLIAASYFEHYIFAGAPNLVGIKR